jgi:hypothetical protein
MRKSIKGADELDYAYSIIKEMPQWQDAGTGRSWPIFSKWQWNVLRKAAQTAQNLHSKI